MPPYKQLPHTSDIRLSISAQTKEALFLSALQGMSELLQKGFCDQQNGSQPEADRIEITATDTTGLLVDFLSEVLTRCHIRKVIYCGIVFLELSDTNLKATISGKKADHFEEDIKAVTYHEADVRINENNQYETIIIFDI